MEKKKRLATFTVKVPLQFTFAGDNELDCDDLIKTAKAELYKRLDNGYFDIVESELEIPKKVTHYTREELRERNRKWDEIFKGVTL